ncbi:translation initiation factor eIF 4e-like domain-containing protein [Talaromyces proteolyticus]|uniref:Translation initiation factor eIF 4e-like domain-containing protein n=1 Tax=Talaromyces proteolyticus TaxID=1131652 RepID=A0AAD4Q2V6_9EURO|nr:translation initiation factor eIF 4e-like domain-containing protein [Talaromyces proteolyticus]KAH8704072.1 translation initiation factor eIF 4e-like domain-containing protein [Talaromyces proteolyticus]
MPEPIIQVKTFEGYPIPDDTTPTTRKTLHQNILGKLRPLPLLYHWTVWFDRYTNPADTTDPEKQYTSRQTILYEDVADIATFYRVYNNYPWNKIRLRDTVHIFRKGTKPVWEDPENRLGGCWTFRVPKPLSQQFFHELAILTIANELQAAVEGEHDHILGVSTSARFNSYLISVWNKHGSNAASIKILEETIIKRLSPELRPIQNSNSYFYKKHADREGYDEAIRAFTGSSDRASFVS